MLKSLLLIVVCTIGCRAHQTQPPTPAQLRTAIASGNVASVKSLTQHKDLINAATSTGVTPLMIAASGGNLEIVKDLVKAGALVEANTTERKITPLMCAAAFGHRDIAEFLVDNGASATTKDAKDYSVLDYAMLPRDPKTDTIKDQTLSTSKYLVTKGAKTRMGFDALATLLAIGEFEELQKLLDAAKAEK